MIDITLPDGSVRPYPAGTNGMDIAKSISNSLAKKVLAIKIDDNVCELSRPINDNAQISLLTWDNPEGKEVYWHSSAHLLAEAVQELYPHAKFTIGPPIENGFYYDIDFGGQVPSGDDLGKIEALMQKLAQQKNPFVRSEVSKADALAYYQERDNPYKVELIEALNDGEITFYQQGKFTDLCRGPHLPDTGYIKAIKLLNLAGAYWRGSEKNPQLTRIYGITFPQTTDLDNYLQMLEEAKRRDHRKIGKDLEIFTFDDEVGPGLPLWLPNGGIIIEQLEAFAKKTEEEAGYYRVKTPHIAKESLYLRSGHLPYYADSMFPPMVLDGEKYYLKAMNCPHHHKIFGAQSHSYRDLPIRFAEYGTCYRYEQSGELMGLMRVRSMQMNDAHIYCTEDQFESEFRAVNDLYVKYFKRFGIDKYVMRFSKHTPEKLGQKYIDSPELWQKTEDMVRRVLINSNIPFIEVEDEAAFYGPKIDVQLWSAIGREFTIATNQVDFAQAERFDLWYTDQNGEKKRPLIIHRAPLGPHERYIGFLLEHYAGNLPLWLAPKQVAILPISDKYMDYAEQLLSQLRTHRVRASIDTRSEKIGRKIRDAEMKKVPYMLVVGEKEAAEGKISPRRHGKGDLGTTTISEFMQQFNEELGE